MTRRDDDEARAVPVTLRNKEDEEVSSLDTSNETADGDYDVPLDKGGAFSCFRCAALFGPADGQASPVTRRDNDEAS